MILLFHSLLLGINGVLNRYRECVAYSVSEKVIYSGSSNYCVEGVTFDPPMYIQRQEAVYKILDDVCLRLQIKKVVDFGCGGLEYFKIFKNLNGVEEILEIDVNAALLEKQHSTLMPTSGDFLAKRKYQLNVKVLAGSISEVDSRLLGTDAVICVEVIEHLFPETLENVPYTVFGFMRPHIAIFTTPNREFNILFELATPFRDDDHKFEWSRQQFRCWGYNIIKRYPDYTVTFYGIGKGPEGAESLGCCSQMAVFIRKSTFTNEAVPESLTDEEGPLIYKFIAEYIYPANINFEQEDKCVVSEIEAVIRDMGLSADEQNSEASIPLSLLHSKLGLSSPTVNELQYILENAKWKIKTISGEVHVLPFFEGYDTDSISGHQSDTTDYQSEIHNCSDDECVDDNAVTLKHAQSNIGSWDHCCQDNELWDTPDQDCSPV